MIFTVGVVLWVVGEVMESKASPGGRVDALATLVSAAGQWSIIASLLLLAWNHLP